jgi:hypothetical protein
MRNSKQAMKKEAVQYARDKCAIECYWQVNSVKNDLIVMSDY